MNEGLHKCPKCHELTHTEHKCVDSGIKRLKIVSMSLEGAKKWLNEVLISKAFK